MSKTGCWPQNDSSPGSSCNQRFEVMDELNRHYTERIKKIEKAGHTELLVCNLKKWIDSLVSHDKVLIKTIESLESEALKRSEKITKLCKDRTEVEEICQNYKQELCEKTNIIKELNSRIKEQADCLNQKECLIKKLNEELKQLKECVDKLKKQSEKQCGESEQSITNIKCELDNLRKEVGIKESKINNLEEDLCKCRKELEEIKDKSQHVRYNGRVNELELKLERAREEICCLRKKLESKEAEITSMREINYKSQDINKIDKVLIPDSMLSLKIEEFQRFTDESRKKLEDTLHDVKLHAGNLLLKEEIEDLNCFLNAEQETFVKANRQLHVLWCNIKNTNPSLGNPANYKIQSIGNKLKSALEDVERERTTNTNNCAHENREMKKGFLDTLIVKLRESLKIICDLKQDAPQVAESTDPVSSASNTKLIQELQEMIKTIQNQSKIQQSRLYATLDNQKEETGILCKKFSEVDYLLKSQCKSINYVKDELKIALCNITQKAEKVRKQAEGISNFECSVKEISNWVNQNVKNNTEVMSKLCNLQSNLEQIRSMKFGLEDSRKEGKNCKMVAYRQSTGQSQSTPELGSSDAQELDLNDFDDKCLVARELCDEVKVELEKAACRINEREQKLTQLSKDLTCYSDTIGRLQEDIMKSIDILSGDYAECSDEFNTYEEVNSHLHDSNNQLMKTLHNMKHKLMNHHKDADSYDMKGIESRKVITSRLNELEEALNNISEFLGEIKENDYIKSKRVNSSECLSDEEEPMASDMSIVEMSKLCSIQRQQTDSSYDVEIDEVRQDSSFSNNQIITHGRLIKELRSEICNLNETISDLQNQNRTNEEKIQILKCQLTSTKEEADKTIRSMVSSLQEKCQTMEPLVDSCEMTKLTSENQRQKREVSDLKELLKVKCDKVNMMKREYVQLTQEINQLTVIVQEEKIHSKKRECDMNKQNIELRREISWLKQKLQDTCQKHGNQHSVDTIRVELPQDEVLNEYKKKLQCVQDNYTTLLSQYRELCRSHDNLKRIISRGVDQRPRDEQSESSDGYEQISQKYSSALKEINSLRCELKHLNCENERLNNENEQLTKERDELDREVERIRCDQEDILKNSDDRENLLCELKNCEDEIKCLKNEYNTVGKNNELLVLENDDLKLELEKITEKYGQLNGKFKDLVDRYNCLRNENDKLHMDKLKMQKDMTDQSEKSKLLRDEDCRENLTLKQKYEELKQELKCAEFKIEELEADISKVEKRNLETAILEADTQLLITKTDQEWNEMYVKKCTEVMELTEEIECLRKKIMNMNEQILERSELSNQSKRVIAMMKKTLQDYKTQIVCLKNKLEKCINWNRDMKRQTDVLEKSNRSMKQFICFLNKEKKGLLDKISQLQSEGSYTYDDSMC